MKKVNNWRNEDLFMKSGGNQCKYKICITTFGPFYKYFYAQKYQVVDKKQNYATIFFLQNSDILFKV